MRLFVNHRIGCRFEEPRSRLVHLMRLFPGNHAAQNVIGWRINVDRDARLRRGRDGYGNETTMLYLAGPLDSVAVTVSGEVLTEDRAGMIGGAAEPLPPLHFLQPTPLTRADESIRDFVTTLKLPTDRLPAAHQLAEAIHERLVLVDPDAELDHRAATRFAEGSADAEGAAHLLIAAARGAGFPARYAAGHLYRPYEAAARAMHGWAELYVDGYGWIGFDSHEGRCPTESYVRVGIGLDSAQAGPIAGAGVPIEMTVHVGPEPIRPD